MIFLFLSYKCEHGEYFCLVIRFSTSTMGGSRVTPLTLQVRVVGADDLDRLLSLKTRCTGVQTSLQSVGVL